MLLTLLLCVGIVLSDPHWQPYMEQAVRLIYFLAESPDQLCGRLLQRSSRLLLEQAAEARPTSQSDDALAVQSQEESPQSQANSQDPEDQGEQGRPTLYTFSVTLKNNNS